MDDRGRLARFGGVRNDMPVAARVRRFLIPLADRLRREMPEAKVDLDVTGDPVERAVLSAELGIPPAVLARIGYEAGEIAGIVSVGQKAEHWGDLGERLKAMAGHYPEVAVFDAESSALRFSAPAGDARREEIAFLLLREAGRALPGLAR